MVRSSHLAIAELSHISDRQRHFAPMMHIMQSVQDGILEPLLYAIISPGDGTDSKLRMRDFFDKASAPSSSTQGAQGVIVRTLLHNQAQASSNSADAQTLKLMQWDAGVCVVVREKAAPGRIFGTWTEMSMPMQVFDHDTAENLVTMGWWV